MSPVKVAAGLAIALGFIFRAISFAYFKSHERGIPLQGPERARFNRKRARALILDNAFIVFGLYLLIR